MNKSETIKEISVALHKAQAKIKAALKDATNPHFKSKYADLSSVVEAVKAPLLEAGIVFLQGVEDAENGVAVETMLLHTSGEWLSSTLKIPATKQDAQGYGSAITYGRRYGLQSMCGVPAEDDDGNAATAAAPKAQSKITPNSGAGDGLTNTVKQRCADIAIEAKDFLAVGKEWDAYQALETAKLEMDEKLYIWTLFDSKERAAIKRMQNAENKQAVPA